MVKSLAFETDKDYTNQFFIIEKRENISVIDELYETLNIYNDQLPFIPTHILCRLYPFKKIQIKHNITYHSAFSIHSNNDELEILTASNFEENIIFNISSTQFKIAEIYRKLNYNLIFELHFIHSRKKINIRLSNVKTCECLRCKFNQLDYYSSLSMLIEINAVSQVEQLKSAYLHYEFGNFKTSLQLFFSLYENSQQNNKSLLGLICLYNLKRLQHFIKAHFIATDNSVNGIFERIDALTLSAYMLKYSNEQSFVKENMKWIAENSFYYDTYNNIVSIVDKIRDHYYLQLTGGNSSNDNLRSLLSEFAEIDNYLNANFIIYTRYTEYHKLFDKILEGLFMSYALNTHQSSRLESFDDYLLLKIITYANTEKIMQYCNRYNISRLAYVRDQKESSSLEQTINNFFHNYPKLIQLSNERLEEKAFFLKNEYRRIVLNMIVILTIIDHIPENFSVIALNLITLLTSEKAINTTDLKYVANFIFKKGKYFSKSCADSWLRMSLRRAWLHNEELFDAIQYQVNKCHKQLLISEEQLYETVLNCFLEQCTLCNTKHGGHLLVKSYLLLSDQMRNSASEKIIKKLTENFDADLYYHVSIFGIIDFRLFFNEYLESLAIGEQNLTFHKSFYERESNITDLNQLINLCLKNNTDLRDAVFNKFRGVSMYYDWLLDMDGFEYMNFNVEWILEYPTEYYLIAIFKIEEVKNIVANYIKGSKHPKLIEYYMK